MSLAPVTCLNIEPTNKCTLACPRCVRTSEKHLFKTTEITLAVLKKGLDEEVLRHLKVVDLSGNYGDPIYHSDLPGIVSFFKNRGMKIYIETNGSRRSAKWWNCLAGLLDKNDEIVFSVDGLADTNELYRINSRWDDIQQAMRICEKKTSITWKFIIFKHNQHQIAQARDMAKEIGCRHFKLVKSLLFFPDIPGGDSLVPDSEFLNDEIKERFGLLKRRPTPAILGPHPAVSARCSISEKHYISAEGYYFPCCWIAHKRVIESSFFKEDLEQLSLKNHTLSEIRRSPLLKRLSGSWIDGKRTPMSCTENCTYGTGARNSKSKHRVAVNRLFE